MTVSMQSLTKVTLHHIPSLANEISAPQALVKSGEEIPPTLEALYGNTFKNTLQQSTSTGQHDLYVLSY